MGDKLKVGFIGCGNISGQYVKGCRQFDILEIAAVSDLDMQRAKDVAKKHGIPKACAVDDLLARVFLADMEKSVELREPLPGNWSDYLAELLADTL